MSERPDAYLFDLDGTLVDTAPDLHVALDHTLATINVAPADISLTRHWVGRGARKIIFNALKKFNGHSPSEEIIEELYEVFIGYYRQRIAEFSRPYCGVRLTLHHFAEAGMQLGVVTNKRYDLSYHLLEELNLLRYFDIVVGADTLPVSKPNPEPLLHACKELGTVPSDTPYVGDSDTDVLTARAAGCPVFLLPYGYNQGIPVASLNPDRTIQSLVELV